jgi:hypothetical protein
MYRRKILMQQSKSDEESIPRSLTDFYDKEMFALAHRNGETI